MSLVSLPHLCMLDATPPEIIKSASAAGFDAVGIRLMPTMKGEKRHPMSNNSPMMRECLSLLAETGLKVLDIETFWLRPDTDPRAFQAEIEAAAQLGAQSLQVASADEDLSKTKDRFAMFAELAGPLNLRVEFEYMAISKVSSLATAVEILDYSGADNCGILVDTLHIARCNTSIAELAALRPDYVNVFQLCDAPMQAPATMEGMVEEARFGRLLPGDGELRLAECWAVMPAHANVSVEVPLAAVRHLPFEGRAKSIMAGYRRFCEGCVSPRKLHRTGRKGRKEADETQIG